VGLVCGWCVAYMRGCVCWAVACCPVCTVVCAGVVLVVPVRPELVLAVWGMAGWLWQALCHVLRQALCHVLWQGLCHVLWQALCHVLWQALCHVLWQHATGVV
jgi:hypothetical protein